MMKNMNCSLSNCECLFLLFVVMASGTLFTTDYPYALYGIIVVFFYMVVTKRFEYHYKMSLIVAIVSVMGLISIVLNLLFSGGKDVDLVLKNVALLLSIVLFAMNKPSRNLNRLDFVAKSILFISIISNLLFIKILLSGNFELSQSSSTETFHYHYIASIDNNPLGGFVIRNGGFYWEPGMYQVYLTFILWYFLYKPNQKFRWLIILYIIFSTISTFSVSGFAVIIALIGIFMFKNDRGTIFRIIFIVISLTAFVIVLPKLQESKEIKQNTGSAEARSHDLTLGFDVFMSSPVVGYGIGNKEYQKAHKQHFQIERPCSNGLMNFLIQTGLLGLLLIMIGIKDFIKWASKNISSNTSIAFLVWYLISINTEPITIQPVLCFVMGVGIAFKFERIMTRKEKPSIAKIENC